MIWLALTLPGLIVAYFLFLRPVLHNLPQFKQFYDEADGFWQTVWALTGKSLTIAWSYITTLIGFSLQWVDPIATLFGDPDFRQNLTESLNTNPKVLGYVMMAISLVTIAARLRSFAKAADQ